MSITWLKKQIWTNSNPEKAMSTSPRDIDYTLLARCAKGDQDALRLLYERHQDTVFRLATRMSEDPEDAKEILQEVFLRVWRGAEGFRQDAAFSTWLYRITVNTTRAHLSQRKRHPYAVLDHEPSFTEDLRDPWARKQLLSALRQLPPRYREVIVLHDIEDRSHPEIAEILEISVGTSKSQLHKARKYMHSLLQGAMS